MRGKVNISHIDHISEIMTAHIINIANIMYISTKKRGRGQTGLVSTTSAGGAVVYLHNTALALFILRGRS